jgi:hypothetical protein
MNLRQLLLFSIIVFSCFVPTTQANAQFWKNWFHKEEKRHFPPKAKKKSEETPAVSKKKRKVVEYPASKIKSRYRVDILVPLFLDDLVKGGKAIKGRLPESTLTGVNFYEGVKLAADTLSALGYHIDLYIHDISDKKTSAEALIKDGTLLNADLIIGDVQSNQIPALASFAKENEINFISAVSPSDAEINNNLFFTMLQPTLQKHVERINAAALKKFPKRDVLLLYRTNNPVDSLAAFYALQDEDRDFKRVLLNRSLPFNEVSRLIDSNSINVMVIPILDNDYAESILQQLSLSFPAYQFEVYGMPSWKYINSLRKADAYPNIAVYFTSPFYYDMTTPAAQSLAGRYRKQFEGRMSEMVFRGYETFYWFSYLLNRYGTVYNTRQSDHSAAPFTKFEIKLQWNKQQEMLYNENEHLDLYRFQSGSFLIQSL